MRGLVRSIRTLSVSALLLLATAPARATYVQVEFSGPSQPYYSQIGPTSLSASGYGVLAAADLGSGSLRASAHHDGSTNTYGAEAAAYFFSVGLTNAGLAPVTLGDSLHPLTLDVSAVMSDAGVGDGLIYHVVDAGFVSALNGVSLPDTGLHFQYSTTWSSGTASHSALTLQPQAAVTIEQATYGALAFTLALPEVTLNPGDSLSINAFLGVQSRMITDFSYGPTGITDAASTPARLQLVLPRGSQITSDAGVPLTWITVPEPSLAVLVGVALALLARSQKSGS